jgi:hypothetical protein
VGLGAAGMAAGRSRAGDVDAGAPGIRPGPTTTTSLRPSVLAAPTVGLDHAGSYERLEPVSERTSPQGVVVRTERPVGVLQPCGGLLWCPPPECRSRLALVVHVGSGSALVVGEAVEPAPITAPPMAIGGTGTWPVGDAEGLWTAIRVPEAVTQVELVVQGRVRDAAPVIDRWAVVAATLPPRTAIGAGELLGVARDDAGREVGRVVLGFAMPAATRTPPATCEAPAPPLPRPGDEQPADAEAAAIAVRAAFVQLFGHGSTREARLAVVDDTSGLGAPMDRVARDFPRAVETTTVTVGDLVFTSATEARVHYRLDYEGGASLGNRVGDAVFVDGAWKIRRETYCGVLAGAGAPCPPPTTGG